MKLGLSQIVTIDFSEKDKYIITDRLKGWNFLTGIFEMSIKNSMIYQTVGLILGTILFVFLDKSLNIFNMTIFFILISVWVIVWTTYYLTKSEKFKEQVINWIENKNK